MSLIGRFVIFLFLLSFNVLNAASHITGVSPPMGHTSGGTAVKIEGKGFTHAIAVKIGNKSAPFSIHSDSLIIATLPAHSPKVVPITVETPDGTSPITSHALFTYQGELLTYIVHADTPFLSVIETATNKLIASPVIEEKPKEIAMSVDGTKMYIHLPTAIAILDTATQEVIAKLSASDSEGIVYQLKNEALLLRPSSFTQEVILQRGSLEEHSTSLLSNEIATIDCKNNSPVLIDNQDLPLLFPLTEEEISQHILTMPDQAPLAKFEYCAAPAGSPTLFDASASLSPIGTITHYCWEFGDGHTLKTAEAVINHTFEKPGSYPVFLVVTNSLGTSVETIFNQDLRSVDRANSLIHNGGPTAHTQHTLDIPYPFQTDNPIKIPTGREKRTRLGAPPVITSSSLTSGQTGIAFNYQIVATNSPTSYGENNLPPGLTINTSTGLISGVPTAVGSYSGTMSATNSDGTGTASLTIDITLGPPVITSPSTASGIVGASFNYTITATNSPTSFGATGLPLGLLINPITGVITGTPIASGIFHATISATNASGTGSAPLTITIFAPPVITSSSSASGQTGVTFSYQITATNSPTSFGATGLPPGLTINTNTGLISGIPTAIGVFTGTMSATNPAGTDTKPLTITINLGSPVITSPSTASGTVGIPFSYQITATNSPTSFGATGLPAGLTINTNTGLISGTPTVSGTFNATLSASNSAGTGSSSLTITITNLPPVITSPATASGQTGTPFSYQITATNSPTSFEASNLPPNLTINTSTGLISGTPVNSGIFSVTISATNTAGTSNASLTINICSSPKFTSAASVNGVINSPFNFIITTSGFPIPTITINGNLPSGIFFINNDNGTATLSGTPTTSGIFTLTLQASNECGNNAIQVLTVSIAACPAPTFLTTSLTNGVISKQYFQQIETTGGIEPITFSIQTGSLPEGLILNPLTGVISGTPLVSGTFPLTLLAISNCGSMSSHLFTIVIQPEAPTHLRGRQVKNEFATQIDIVNIVTWRPPSGATIPAFYQIYRDSSLRKLLASIPAEEELRFEEHNRKPEKTYRYFIVTIDQAGNISEPRGVVIRR